MNNQLETIEDAQKVAILLENFADGLDLLDKEFNDSIVECRIENVLKIKHGKNQKTIECKDGIYPILATSGEIGRTNTCLWHKPCVLIGRKGTINKPQYMDTPFWTVDTLFYSDVNNSNHAKYLYYLCKT